MARSHTYINALLYLNQPGGGCSISTTVEASRAIEISKTMSWPDIQVGGDLVSLAHLRPFIMLLNGIGTNIPEPLRILVRYSDHCFGKHISGVADGRVAFPWCSKTSADKRGFDKKIYDYTHRLVEAVNTLERSRVRQSSQMRNWVLVTQDKDEGGTPYNLFFSFHRASKSADHHLELVVVSCHSGNTPSISARNKPENVRFTLLCSKIWKGETIKFI